MGIALSIQSRHHLILAHRRQVVDVKSLAGQNGLHVRRHELRIEVWCDRQFCSRILVLLHMKHELCTSHIP